MAADGAVSESGQPAAPAPGYAGGKPTHPQMPFVVKAPPYEPFAALFDLDDAALAARGGVRQRVEEKPGTPFAASV